MITFLIVSLCVLMFIVLFCAIIVSVFAFDELVLNGHYAKKIRGKLGIE